MAIKTTLLPKVVKREFHAEQGLRLSCPARRQMHWLRAREPGSVIFALVLNVNGDLCDVIPGSKDAMQAGPDDIILPRNVMGNFVMLSPEGYATIPVDSLGIGFARLDTDVFDKVVEAIALSMEGELENCGCGFETGFPFLNDNDERLSYRRKMFDCFIAAQNGTRTKGKGAWGWAALEFSPDFGMAADDAPENESRCFKLFVEGKQYELVLTLSRERELMDCCLYRDNGELAEEIDGWTVVARDGVEMIQVPIRCGLCDFPAEFLDNGIVILDENNKRVF